MTAEQLVASARCFDQCIPPGMRQAVIISLLDQIAAGGGGGGSQTPWLSNIDGGGFSLSNVNSITATSFIGALTGAASANVLKAGDTMTGPLLLPVGSSAFPALDFQGGYGFYRGATQGGGAIIAVDAGSDQWAVGQNSGVGTVQLGPVSWSTAIAAATDLRLLRTGAGILTVDDGAGAFTRFNIGPATVAFPALKRFTTTLQCRLADDSAFTNIQGKLTTDANAVTGLVAGALAALTNATVTITDASGQVFRVPCII